MNEPLRIAIAGGGKMARQHAEAIGCSSVPSQIVAFADPNAAVRDQLKSLYPSAETFSGLGALLDATTVDVVHVCTPPSTHGSLAVEALRGGCHVYVEKPFASTVAEAREILDLADAERRKVTAGHQVLFQRSARRAGELASGLGTLTHVESYFSFRPSRGRGDGSVPLRADEQLLDVLPHPVYLLLDALAQAQQNAESAQIEVLQVSRGPGGTVHAQIRVGSTTGHLVVTLEGRPVESYLRLVGTRGSVSADFVRDTVQHQLGPGSSAIDKVLAPYRTTVQLLTGTTTGLLSRLFNRNHGYPGLTEAIRSFHRSIVDFSLPPLGDEHLLGTVAVCEAIADVIQSPPSISDARREDVEYGGRDRSSRDVVAVTGGTGFLGDAVVARLVDLGVPIRAISRRLPAPWSRRPGVDYRSEDLAGNLEPHVFENVDVVVHCAAETAGGWDAHRRNSVAATENVIRTAHAAGATSVIHVSSVAVLEETDDELLNEDSSLRSDDRSSGPYVWGKLESERRAQAIGEEVGLTVKVVRPGAIIDMENFDPPGRLGRRIGNLYLAIGAPKEPLDSISLSLAAEALARMATRFDDAPEVLNLVDPEPLTRGKAVEHLRESDPTVKVIRLPRAVFTPLAWAAILTQKVLRPTSQPINPAAAFSSRRYDTGCLKAYLNRCMTPQNRPGQVQSADGRTASQPATSQ